MKLFKWRLIDNYITNVIKERYGHNEYCCLNRKKQLWYLIYKIECCHQVTYNGHWSKKQWMFLSTHIVVLYRFCYFNLKSKYLVFCRGSNSKNWHCMYRQWYLYISQHILQYNDLSVPSNTFLLTKQDTLRAD